MKKNKNILIVEDERIIAMDLEIQLVEMGYHVSGSVRSGSDALASIEKCLPDLILMDIMIEGPIDGIETARLINLRFDLPIVYLTANADEPTIERAVGSSPYGYILKPFDDKALSIAIRVVLEKHELEKKLKQSQTIYKSLFENTFEAIIIFDDNGQIRQANSSATKLLAKSKTQNQGLGIFEQFYSKINHPDPTILQDFISSGQAQGRFRWQQDSDWCVIEYHAKAYYLPGLHMAVLKDISQKFKAQKRIESLSLFASQAPSPILRVNQSGKILYANRAAEILTNYWQKKRPGYLPANLAIRIHELNEHQPNMLININVDGKIFSLLLVRIPAKAYINIYANDISRQKRSERIVNHQKDILEIIAKNLPLSNILEQICIKIESFTGSMTAVFIPDQSKNFTFTTAPQLPLEICIGLQNGKLSQLPAFGQAMQAKEPFFIDDLQNNNFWGSYTEIFCRYGFCSSWILPVINQNREVVACLAVFYKQIQKLEIAQVNLINIACNLISIAIERDLSLQSLRKQSLAFENISDAIILTDPDGIINEWSPTAEKLFGRRSKEVIGQNIQNLQIFDKIEPSNQVLNCFETSVGDANNFERWNGQIQFSPYNKTNICFAECSVLRLSGYQDMQLGLLIVIRDITKKRLIEQAMKTSQANFKAIFDNTIQSFILLSPDRHIIAFNQTANQTFYQLQSKPLQQGQLLDFYWNITTSEELIDKANQAMQGQYSCEQVCVNTVINDLVWLEISFFPIYDENKNVSSICFIAFNIDERKKSELALTQSKARFMSLVQNSSDVIMQLDTDGRLGYVSESVQNAFGYNADSMSGTKLEQIIHPEDIILFNNYLAAIISNQIGASKPLIYRLQNARKEYIYVESVASNLLDEPAVDSIVLNSRNVSERVASEIMFKSIVSGVAGAVGTDFFGSLVAHLAKGMKIAHAVIAYVDVPNDLVRTVAVYTNEVMVPNKTMRYDTSIWLHQSGHKVINQQDLPTLKLDTPEPLHIIIKHLTNSNGSLMGVLYVAQPMPFQNLEQNSSILEIFASRASAELERQQVMGELLTSKASLMAVIENTGDNIWTLTPEYKLDVFNSAARQFFMAAYQVNIERGDNILNYMSAKDHEFWKIYYQQAFNGIRTTKEVRFMIADTAIHYEFLFNPVFSNELAVKGVSVFARNITERKKVKIAMRNSEINLRAIIENTEDIICLINKNGLLLMANSAARELHKKGFGKEIKIGAFFLELLPKEYHQQAEEYLERAMQGEKFSQEIRVELPEKNIDYEISFNPIDGPNRTNNGVTIFAHDITFRKQAENELKQTNFELDSFVYRASHDLRAPLRSVLGIVNLLKIEKQEDQQNLYLKLIEKSVNKLDDFIANLTNYSRNSRLEIHRELIDFNIIIQECSENVKFMDNATVVQTSISIENTSDFYSDPTRLCIILQNLYSNAIKYSRNIDGSYVHTRIQTDDLQTIIIVEDNGKGIDNQYIDRIYDMFFRAHQESYGSGLGLYITRQVVEKLQGQISVSTQVGQGTKFTIVLPNMK